MLRVYAKKDSIQLLIFVYDPHNETYFSLGDFTTVSFTGNSGAIYAPYAITKDNANIILDAWMGDPGAGGGNVDYGFAIIPLKPIAQKDRYDEKDFPYIATRSAHFYDSFGKVVYVTEGDNTPHHSIPGPSNNAQIAFRDLTTGQTKTLLEEQDTSYEIEKIDEKSGILVMQTTKYKFSSACPRGEDSQDCAKKNTSERTITLP